MIIIETYIRNIEHILWKNAILLSMILDNTYVLHHNPMENYFYFTSNSISNPQPPMNDVIKQLFLSKTILYEFLIKHC